MKAAIYTKFGPADVVHIADIEKPVPKDNEVLIRVHAVSLNALDYRMMKGAPYIVRMLFGMRKPSAASPGRPGRDVAGRVEAVGGKVTQFKPGDDVFGVCPGAAAEYACAAEDKLALKSPTVSFEEAAALPIAAITALQGLRDKGKIQQGHTVLVDGASGGVGTFAIQIAKSFGAQVTAVCSTRNVEAARAMGADHVIDYTQTDFTRSGRRYNLIIAANGHHSIFAYRRALNPKGIYVMAGGGIPQILQTFLLGPLLSRMGSKKMRSFMARIDKKDLLVLQELLESKKVVPAIEKRFPLGETGEAIRYLAEGHARGKVVITMGNSNGA
jgi:NADPH:quinone reductase-like Zn-dependent oxidoreductase